MKDAGARGGQNFEEYFNTDAKRKVDLDIERQFGPRVGTQFLGPKGRA